MKQDFWDDGGKSCFNNLVRVIFLSPPLSNQIILFVIYIICILSLFTTLSILIMLSIWSTASTYVTDNWCVDSSDVNNHNLSVFLFIISHVCNTLSFVVPPPKREDHTLAIIITTIIRWETRDWQSCETSFVPLLRLARLSSFQECLRPLPPSLPSPKTKIDQSFAFIFPGGVEGTHKVPSPRKVKVEEADNTKRVKERADQDQTKTRKGETSQHHPFHLSPVATP